MQNKQLTLGSLFDGSGGFPLGGLLAGITPVWASEIEPFPIRVTTKRMPWVKHYGDISQMDGGRIEPVDIITFGSPCQDMSVAGKRSGLDGSRSSLFYEAIRIIKEMRCATNGKYPRYIVWENVPGAFSSNGGEDFRCVLESICRVKDEKLSVPRPAKWLPAGEVVGKGFSIAYRVLNACAWGVPQRRKRIYLVADFDGGSAGKILFESEGVSGYTPQGFRAWESITAGAAEGTSAAGFDGYNGCLTGDVSSTLGVNCGMSTGRSGMLVLNDQGGNRMDVTDEITCTLRAEAHHPPCVMESAGFCTEHSAKARSIGYEDECSPTLRAGTVPAAIAVENHPTDSRVKLSDDGTVQTLTSRMGTGDNNVPLLLKIRCGCEGGGKGPLIQKDVSATLSCNNDQTLFAPKSLDCRNMAVNEEISGTLQAKNNGGHSLNYTNPVAYGICSKDSNAMKSANPSSGFYEADTSRTLDGNGGNPSCNQGGMAVVCVDQGGGKSSVNISEEVAPTLATSHGGEPVVAIEGNGSRPSHHGDGYCEGDAMYTLNTTEVHAVAFTQNQRDEVRDLHNMSGCLNSAFGTKQQTFVAQEKPDAPVYSSSKASFFTEAEKEMANTLVATDYKDPPLVSERPTFGFCPQKKAESMAVTEELSSTLVNGTNPGYQNGIVDPEYIVRRLVPTECARLQGFPDWWCSDLGTERPTDEEIYQWYEIFETHRRITGSSQKPKTGKQIRAFLQNPHSDAAEYKMWGNGVALPCVYFVLSGIVWIHQKGEE